MTGIAISKCGLLRSTALAGCLLATLAWSPAMADGTGGNGGNGGGQGGGGNGAGTSGTGGNGAIAGNGGSGSDGSVAGSGGTGGSPGVDGGDGGVGNSATTLINDGDSITGGGGGGPQADAIQFTGGANTLELRAGSAISGTVEAFSADDTLRLGGNVDSSFDVSGVGQQYQGFGIYEKTGTGAWTLTGSTNAVTSWTIDQGTLSVSSDANLGAASGALTFNGGVLQVTGTSFKSTTRTINWGPGGGSFDIADSANTFTVSQALTGQGGLTKLGAGTLTLTGTNTYSGGTFVNSGTLSISRDAALGDAAGALTLDGGTLKVTPVALSLYM
ncbi:autotransporter outer membrane beta-barrel domain-containing protein, partial [Mesorhizobium sp. M7A.F.Ca.CA.001.15.1.1]|uniref:autotransporter-associated beta strand repeat-containing protein n=1 Tax=Mesorhizobium sp. M7A.F.Ca.CA.001.15.1.1 TaxID=2496713 RepID=UPI000FD3E8F1